MFIDIHVHPAFYDPINGDEAVEEMRHSALDIHKTARRPWNTFSIRCAAPDLTGSACYRRITPRSLAGPW